MNKDETIASQVRGLFSGGNILVKNFLIVLWMSSVFYLRSSVVLFIVVIYGVTAPKRHAVDLKLLIIVSSVFL